MMETRDLGAGGFDILLAHPGHAEAVVREGRQAPQLGVQLDNLRGERGPRWGGYRLEQRAALIPVIGPLVPRGPVGLARFGLTSYEGLRDELRQAAVDADVDTIVLMVDSPGGFVTGLDATSDAILSARRTKPVVAVVEGMAASAAYWLASQADRIIVAPFGAVGSIGALAVHVDVSRALDAAGMTVSVVRAGARKAEGNPFEPLTDEARADLQASLDKVREAFAAAVVAGRAHPDLDIAAVLATEARMFDADEAVALGIADRIGSLDGFVAAPPPALIRRPVLAIAAQLEDPAHPLAEKTVEAAEPNTLAPSVAPPAPAGAAPPQTLGLDPRVDRARISAILRHSFAATEMGRPHAERLAFDSDKRADEALGELDAIAQIYADAKSRAAPTLDEEMAADIQPRVGQDGGRTNDLTAAERGAVGAAQLLGKEPRAALAKLRGQSQEPAAPPGHPAADPATGATTIPR